MEIFSHQVRCFAILKFTLFKMFGGNSLEAEVWKLTSHVQTTNYVFFSGRSEANKFLNTRKGGLWLIFAAPLDDGLTDNAQRFGENSET